MEWYWWVLIGIGCVAIAIIKVKIMGKMMSKKSGKQIEEED